MKHTIRTQARDEMIDITWIVEEDIRMKGMNSGIAVVYIPHTTAGTTINENADPDVKDDILRTLSVLVPEIQGYRHREGNSDAHIKASLMGSSCTVPVEDGRLLLGTWQGIYFCEFDGPRSRTFIVRLMESGK